MTTAKLEEDLNRVKQEMKTATADAKAKAPLSPWEAATPNKKMAKWSKWTNEDWRGMEGTKVIVGGKGGNQEATVLKVFNAPWDIIIKMKNGQQIKRDGPKIKSYPCRIVKK